MKGGPAGGWRGGTSWDRSAFDDRAQQVWHGFSHVAGDRYAGKVAASVKDFARGVGYSIDSGAMEWERGVPFFTALSDLVPAADVKHACLPDPVAYRLMVRPLLHGEMVDRELVRSYMARVEVALGCRLAWAAAIHCKPTPVDPGNRHFHVIIRGATFDCRLLRLSREFRRHGFSCIGRQLMTEVAGLITPEEERHIAEVRARDADVAHQWEQLRRAGWPWWKIRAWVANYRGERKERQWWVHKPEPRASDSLKA